MHVDPYLTFPGTCAAAVAFYQEALGAKCERMMTFRDSPMATQTPKEHLDRVMHVTMKIGSATVMASDDMPGAPDRGFAGVSLSISTKDLADGQRIFDALSNGGTVTMPFADQFWGARFGMVKDRFGVPWMVNVDK